MITCRECGYRNEGRKTCKRCGASLEFKNLDDASVLDDLPDMTRYEINKELKKMLISDLGAVLKEARAMGCKTVSFRDIPVENLELIVSALRAYGR